MARVFVSYEVTILSLFVFLFIGFLTSKATAFTFPAATKIGTFGFCPEADINTQTANFSLVMLSSEKTNATQSKCYIIDKLHTPDDYALCMFLPQTDLISRYINQDGVWEFPKALLLSIFLKEQIAKPFARTIMLDIGANQGYFGFLAASHGYNVIMLEPGDQTSDLLRQTIVKNSWQNKVTVFKNAIGNTRQALSFKFVSDNSGASVVKPDASGETYSILGDDLLFHLKFNPQEVFVIKTDVEGYDFHALDGMYNIIKYGRPPLLIIEVPISNCNHKLVITTLYNIGYTAIKEDQPNKQQPLEEVLSALANNELRELILIDSQMHQEMASHLTSPQSYNGW